MRTGVWCDCDWRSVKKVFQKRMLSNVNVKYSAVCSTNDHIGTQLSSIQALWSIDNVSCQCWSWVQACAGVKYQWPVLVVGELTPPQARSLIHWEPRLGMARTVPEPEPGLTKNEWNCTAESENQAREYKQQSAKLSDSVKTLDIHYFGFIT